MSPEQKKWLRRGIVAVVVILAVWLGVGMLRSLTSSLTSGGGSVATNSQPSRCLPGYSYYPDQNMCFKPNPNRPLVKVEACTPGQVKWVVDPVNPELRHRYECGSR